MKDEVETARKQFNDKMQVLRSDLEKLRKDYEADVITLKDSIIKVSNNLEKVNITMNADAIEPVGTIRILQTSKVPEGWLPCNGASIDCTKRKELCDVLGKNTLPDLRGKFAVGIGGNAQFDQLGETGGEASHTLTEAEMPSHDHTITLLPKQQPFFRYDKSQEDQAWTELRTAPNGPPASSTSKVGSGQAHNNLPPFFVVQYIIKY